MLFQYALDYQKTLRKLCKVPEDDQQQILLGSVVGQAMFPFLQIFCILNAAMCFHHKHSSVYDDYFLYYTTFVHVDLDEAIVFVCFESSFCLWWIEGFQNPDCRNASFAPTANLVLRLKGQFTK